MQQTQVKEKIIQVLNIMSDDDLYSVFDYVRFLYPEEVEPSESELKAIERGRKEFSKGQYVKWREIRRNAL